jgi:hypothetical protein
MAYIEDMEDTTLVCERDNGPFVESAEKSKTQQGGICLGKKN